MAAPLEFGKLITEKAPFFDGDKLIWAGAFIVFSIIFSIMTWRAQHVITQRGRSLMYWSVNAILFCLGVYFITRAFPRLPGGWILAGLCIILFGISGMTVVTKSKDKDKKEGDKEKK